jgi:dimethylamine corrinoid protein
LDFLTSNSTAQQGSRNQIIEKLRHSVIEGNAEAAELAAREALDAGIDPTEAIEEGLASGIREVGKRFQRLDCFLTDMIMAADVMNRAVFILEKALPEKAAPTKAGVVVIGTVAGDIHDIGKNIVAILLKANGFQVHDMGKDIPSRQFIEKAETLHADVIGLSALLSTTMVAQQEVIRILQDLKLRDKYMVIVGGAATTQEWAKDIGADAYGKDANDGIMKTQEFCRNKRSGG